MGSPISSTMEEAASQDGRKRRLTFEPASERGSDKRHRTCCHGEDCELTTKVLAQESTIRNLAGVVEDLLGRLAALEQPPIAISIDHTRTESSKNRKTRSLGATAYRYQHRSYTNRVLETTELPCRQLYKGFRQNRPLASAYPRCL